MKRREFLGRELGSPPLRLCSSLADECPYEAAVGSGATGHFLKEKYRGRNPQIVTKADAAVAECANGSIMAPSSTDELALSKLSKPNKSSKLSKLSKLRLNGLSKLISL